MGDVVIGTGQQRRLVSAQSGAAAAFDPAVPRDEAPSVVPAAASEQSSSRVRALFLLFSIELIALTIARLPETMSFESFAFGDRGANLTLQYLVANGYRPAIDFGYHYGLLPILAARGWFAIFGATPFAYQLAMLACNLLLAWALAKILTRLQIAGIGLALTIIALGFAFQSSYPNLAQALEAVLLCHALAEQARGSRANALGIATAAIFTKPSMGYIYGLLLIILIIRDLARTGLTLRRLTDALAPAALVFLTLAAAASLGYGPRSFLHTVLPIEGVSNYSALNFGLMAAGRELWDPSGLPWISYLIDVSGLWIVSTIFLCGSALFQLARADDGAPGTRRSELMVTCAILHIAFLTLFFGNQWSWIYYSYVLVIGTAIALDRGPSRQSFGLALCAVALLSWTDPAFWSLRRWQTTTPGAATADLWASADEQAEWRKVCAMIHGKNTVTMDSMGAAGLLFSGFDRPVSLYLVPGLKTRSDIQRKLSQLASAELVVAPILPGPCDGVADAPEFATAMKSFERSWTGQHFEVFERVGIP